MIYLQKLVREEEEEGAENGEEEKGDEEPDVGDHTLPVGFAGVEGNHLHQVRRKVEEDEVKETDRG